MDVLGDTEIKKTSVLKSLWFRGLALPHDDLIAKSFVLTGFLPFQQVAVPTVLEPAGRPTLWKPRVCQFSWCNQLEDPKHGVEKSIVYAHLFEPVQAGYSTPLVGI